MKLKCKIIKEPTFYSGIGINLKGEILEGEFNEHGAFGVPRQTLKDLGCNMDAFCGKPTVFFTSKHVKIVGGVDVLEKALVNANMQSAKYYAWYLNACTKVEQLTGELAHAKRKISASDTK